MNRNDKENMAIILIVMIICSFGLIEAIKKDALSDPNTVNQKLFVRDDID